MENIKNKTRIQNIKIPAIKARNREHLRSLVNTSVTSPLSTKLTKFDLISYRPCH